MSIEHETIKQDTLNSTPKVSLAVSKGRELFAWCSRRLFCKNRGELQLAGSIILKQYQQKTLKN